MVLAKLPFGPKVVIMEAVNMRINGKTAIKGVAFQEGDKDDNGYNRTFFECGTLLEDMYNFRC